MSTIKSDTADLTLNADGASSSLKLQIDGVEKASVSAAGAFTSTSIDATKLTGALPALDGSALTSLTSGNLSGALPAISGAALTNLPAGGATDINGLSDGITTATGNIGLGGATATITTGDYNVGFGGAALTATTGSYNTAVGKSALASMSTANDNTAIGSWAMSHSPSGNSNTAVGKEALKSSVGNDNTAVGFEALKLHTTGYQNIAFGGRALDSVTTGYNNVGVGYYAGENITTGSNNITIGCDLSAQSSTGSHQLNIGKMYLACADGTVGNANTALVSGTYAPILPGSLSGGETANSMIYSGNCGTNFVSGCAANTWHLCDVFNFQGYGDYHDGRGFLITIFWTGTGGASRGYNYHCRIFCPPFSSNTSSGYSTGSGYTVTTNGGSIEHGVEAVVSMHTTAPGGLPNIQFRHQTPSNAGPMYLQIFTDVPPNAVPKMRIRSL
jgi:hypothetical protein